MEESFKSLELLMDFGVSFSPLVRTARVYGNTLRASSKDLSGSAGTVPTARAPDVPPVLRR